LVSGNLASFLQIKVALSPFPQRPLTTSRASGVFLTHYLSTSAFPGATSLEYAFIAGLSVSQSLLSPLVTTISRIYSTRTTLAIGVLLQTAALIGTSFAAKTWHLFLSQDLCFGWGLGFLIIGSAGIIPQ
jgi:hypothetical protein